MSLDVAIFGSDVLAPRWHVKKSCSEVLHFAE